MSDRAYTIKEVHALRKVVEGKSIFGRYTSDWHTTRFQGYGVDDIYKELLIERQVVTWMLAGITADDLIASEVKE